MIEAERVREILKNVAPTIDWKAVGDEDSLAGAGLDSLDKASLFLEVERLAGRTIPDEHYDRIDNIKAIQEYVGDS